MRVLITGGLGFIGSHMADRLVKNGHDVFIIDNLETGRMENKNEKIPAENIFINSIADEDLCNKVFERAAPDIVIHTAASYKNSDTWAWDVLNNIHGTMEILTSCEVYGVGRLIYLQTSLCYGSPANKDLIKESQFVNPQNSYSITKTAAEQFIQLSGINYISFRLSNIYGPRNLSGAIPAFYKNLASGKPSWIAGATRDFVYIDDLCEILMAAVHGIGDKGVYNVPSSRQNVPIIEVYKTMAHLMEIEDKEYTAMAPAPDDVESIILDGSKLIMDFEMLPHQRLKKGLWQAIQWYRENGVGETFTHLKDKAYPFTGVDGDVT